MAANKGRKPRDTAAGDVASEGVAAAARGRTTVAVLRTSPQTVREDYAKVMHLAGCQKHLDPEARDILKIDLSWREWYPAASTAPWQLESVLAALEADGANIAAASITAGPGDPAWQRRAAVLNGLAAAAGRAGDDVFAGLRPEQLTGANIIHLPVMKTHVMAGVGGAAMSVRDTFTSSPAPRTVSECTGQILDALRQQRESASGTFTVMDGVLAGGGDGPRTVIPYEKGYLLAGADPVAVDAVAARMMGFAPKSIDYIRAAMEAGLGAGNQDDIELVGDDISQVDFHFQCARPGAKQPAEKYLEYIWYPFRGWPHAGRLAETEWGQLLQQYLPEGAELERQGRGKGPVLAALGSAVALAALGAARLMGARGRRTG